MNKYNSKPAEYQGDDAFDSIPVSGSLDEADLDELIEMQELVLELPENLVELPDMDFSYTDEALGEEESKKKPAKHSGKHSLKYDSIFKGRKTDAATPDDYDPIFDSRQSDKMEIDPGSTFHEEATNPEEYEQGKRLKERVYDLVRTHTAVNISNNRRKPSRADFNRYYKMVITELRGEGFSKPAIFVELAHYFSDNLYNMFRLLDADSGAEILRDLRANSNMRPLDNIDFLY